ncbi:MAG: hypothetical protein KatS3mg051_1570 [Anaerolineae bacterium]|nr:MAG: hypothetical protein KatS3mg051_1570 [Anaerolineae bacterium]
MKITDSLLSTGRLLPTLPEIMRFMQQADADDARYRDPRPLLQVLMRLPDVDPRLAGHMLTRRTAVTAFGWRILDLTPGSSRRAAETALLEAAPVVLAEAIEAAVLTAVDTNLYGAAATELMLVMESSRWDVRVARRARPDELDRPTSRPEDLRLLEVRDGRLERLTFDAARTRSSEQAAWIWDVDESTWQGGVLRRVLVYEVLRRDMLQEWANFSRKLKGIIQAIYRDGVLAEEREAAEEAVKRVVANNYLVTSDAITFEFHRTIQEAAGLNFERILDKLDTDVAIALLGQANTAELLAHGGSRAAVQVLNMIRADIRYADMMRAERLAQRVVDMYYRANVDSQGPVRWRFAFDWSEMDEIDRAEEARTVREALEAGVPLPADEVYARLGYSRPPSAPDVLEPRQGGLLSAIGV